MGLGSRCAALAQLSRVAHVAADTPRCIAFAHVSGSPARCGHAVWRSVLHKLVALPLGPPLLLRPGRLAGYRAGDRTAAGTRRCWYYQQRPVDRYAPLPDRSPLPTPGQVCRKPRPACARAVLPVVCRLVTLRSRPVCLCVRSWPVPRRSCGWLRRTVRGSDSL